MKSSTSETGLTGVLKSLLITTHFIAMCTPYLLNGVRHSSEMRSIRLNKYSASMAGRQTYSLGNSS